MMPPIDLRIQKLSDEFGQYINVLQFDQVATDWVPNRRVLSTYRFTKDSLPPQVVDDHVRIGGTYFDVLDTEYTLREIPGGTEFTPACTPESAQIATGTSGQLLPSWSAILSRQP